MRLSHAGTSSVIILSFPSCQFVSRPRSPLDLSHSFLRQYSVIPAPVVVQGRWDCLRWAPEADSAVVCWPLKSLGSVSSLRAGLQGAAVRPSNRLRHQRAAAARRQRGGGRRRRSGGGTFTERRRTHVRNGTGRPARHRPPSALPLPPPPSGPDRLPVRHPVSGAGGEGPGLLAPGP